MENPSEFNEQFAQENKKNIQQYKRSGPPDDLEKKIIARLKSNGMLYRFMPLHKMRISFPYSAALIVLFFFIGFFLAKNEYRPALAKTMNKYILLLHTPSNYIAQGSHAKEYGNWVKELRSKDPSVSGEELTDNSIMLTASNDLADSGQQKDAVSGFFIINAASEKDAVAIAKSCPHLKYNGTIELRQVRQ